MVWLLTFPAFAEAGTMFGEVTSLKAIHTKVIVFDYCNHPVMRHGLEASTCVQRMFF